MNFHTLSKRVRELVHDEHFQKPIKERNYSTSGGTIKLITNISKIRSYDKIKY